MLTLKGRTALVSGPTGSIGEAVVRRYLAAGMNVVLMSNRIEKAQALAEQLSEYKDHIIPSKAGMREPEYCRENLRSLYERLGSIDVLAIMNGREPTPETVETVDMDEWDDRLSTNLKAPFMFIQSCLPYLSKSKAPRVILTSCMEAQCGSSSAGISFTVAKGGLISLTRICAKQLAPMGITVNCVAPGGMYNINQYSDDVSDGKAVAVQRDKVHWSVAENVSPLGRSCTAEDIAVVYEFLASEEAGFITGDVINVNGGMYCC